MVATVARRLPTSARSSAALRIHAGAPLAACRPAIRLQTHRGEGQCRAGKADDDIFDPQPDVWESQALGIAVQVGFVTVCMAAVAVLLALAQPLIQTTIQAFPDAENGQSGYAALEMDMTRGIID